MTQTLAATKPDVDLTDGNFYADGNARAAYKWMRAQPAGVPGSQRACRGQHLSGRTGRRAQPEVFSNAGGIRPDQPGMPYMIDMDDPAHLLRRKLVNAGFTRKRVMDKVPSIERLRHPDRQRDRARRVRLRPRHRRPAADGGDRRHARRAARGTVDAAELVRRPGCGLSSHLDEAAMQTVMEAFAGYTAFSMDLISKRRAEPRTTCSRSRSTPRSTGSGCPTTRSSWRHC